jgi:hypothetical protein
MTRPNASCTTVTSVMGSETSVCAGEEVSVATTEFWDGDKS